MDKNNLIGFILIFALFFIWVKINAPSPEEMERQEFLRDSTAQAQRLSDSLAILGLAKEPSVAETAPKTVVPESDSLRQLQLYADFGAFAGAAKGVESTHVLENDVFKITFTNKGGKIKEVLLKDYKKIETDKEGVETKVDLKLLEDEKNHFDYLLPVEGVRGVIPSGELYFEPVINGNSIRFRANAGEGKYFEQKYTIDEKSYTVKYEVALNGLGRVLKQGESQLTLNWINYLDKLEKNTAYERNYSSVHYKPAEEDPSYCSCTGDDSEDVDGQKLKWVAHSNQFFNSTLFADTYFSSALLETKTIPEDQPDLKQLVSKINFPLSGGDDLFAMNFYIGPNEYDQMKTLGYDFEDVIPYGWSIFGTINRWIIRPIYNFLSSFIGSAGIVILILTLIVKLALFPLTYKMLYSQSKMGALKPRMTALKEKLGDDQQKVQMETMKLYREFGVSPLGGCLPIALQMPIWFALYRFFPGSIDFRQAEFLWATDLSSYDVFTMLPFEIPFYGAHVSLFTILWAGTTLIYTYYNTKHMDMTMNPAMKYMQYLMPIMFLFFFNNFASGLTCYLFFSNLMNITQTIVTKNYLIDQEKIQKELEAYRKKPKKKGGFSERLESALKEQQKVQQDKTKNKKKEINLL